MIKKNYHRVGRPLVRLMNMQNKKSLLNLYLRFPEVGEPGLQWDMGHSETQPIVHNTLISRLIDNIIY